MNDKKVLWNEINITMNQLNFYIKILKKIIPKFCDFLILKRIKKNELILYINQSYNLWNILFFIKNNTFFQVKTLTDICVIDYPNKIKRFELIYNLLSIKYNFRFLLKTNTTMYNPINSITSLYYSANWLERECWDLFGIFFLNHPDLRRILTDYGFEGFPLRKDFPLTGYIEVRYDDEKSNIVYEPLEISQEYRLFNFTSPWEKIK